MTEQYSFEVATFDLGHPVVVEEVVIAKFHAWNSLSEDVA